MNDTSTKIHVARPTGRFAVEVTIYQHLPGQIRAYQIDYSNTEKRGELVGKLYDVSEAIPCTFEMPEDQWRELLTSFAEEAKGHGIETHDSYIKGKLEATAEHLADTKAILKQVLPNALK